MGHHRGPPESRQPRDNDKAQRDFRINRTEKLAAKARQTDRAREALEVVAKPWEGWDLRFTIEEAARAGTVVARLTGAVIERGLFRMGPLDLEIDLGRPGGAHRAPTGSGKSSLVAALLGHLPLVSGRQWLGPSVVAGELGQDRRTRPGRVGSPDDRTPSATDRATSSVRPWTGTTWSVRPWTGTTWSVRPWTGAA